MSNEPLTRKRLEAVKSGNCLSYEESCDIMAERDQLRASLDIFKSRIQALEVERDAARAEADDFRRSWAILDEPSTLKRMPHTAESAAMMFRQALDAAKAEVAFLDKAMTRDRSGMAEALGQIRKHVRGFSWLFESRGSYEWNDDRYREEAGHAMRPVLEMADRALSSSGDLLFKELRDVRARAAEWLAQHDAKVWGDAQHALLGNGHLVTTLRERVKVLEGALKMSPHGAYCPTMYSPQSKFHGPCNCHHAALSPTTDGAPKPKCAACGDTGRKFIGAPSEEGTQVWQPCPCGALDLVRVISGPDCKAAP